jgi:hypothetical protein
MEMTMGKWLFCSWSREGGGGLSSFCYSPGGNREQVKKSRAKGVAASPLDEEKIGFFRFFF